jgi:hypothetical protein
MPKGWGLVKIESWCRTSWQTFIERYILCPLTPPRAKAFQISPLSNSHEVNSITLTARVVLGHLHEQHGRFSLANILF